MSNNSEEKLFSAQDVAKLVAKVTGSQPQDLIEKIKEQEDLSSFEELQAFFNPIFISRNNAHKKALNDKYDTGHRKGLAKAEKELVEVFQIDNIEGADFASKAMDVKNKVNSNKSKDNKQQITASQAFDVKEVKQSIADKDAQIAKLTGIQGDFDTYKNLQSVKQSALGVLSEHNAVFSTDPTRRRNQIISLERNLQGTIYKENSDGTITVLDEDGATPLHNQGTGENWTWDDWVKSKSPVDFGTAQNNNNKDPYVPPAGNNNSNSDFGYTKAQQAKFTSDDYKNAVATGDAGASDFVKSTMMANAEKEQTK